jgi:hypothetical protein
MCFEGSMRDEESALGICMLVKCTHVGADAHNTVRVLCIETHESQGIVY